MLPVKVNFEWDGVLKDFFKTLVRNATNLCKIEHEKHIFLVKVLFNVFRFCGIIVNHSSNIKSVCCRLGLHIGPVQDGLILHTYPIPKESIPLFRKI